MTRRMKTLITVGRIQPKTLWRTVLLTFITTNGTNEKEILFDNTFFSCHSNTGRKCFMSGRIISFNINLRIKPCAVNKCYPFSVHICVTEIRGSREMRVNHSGKKYEAF